MGKSPKHTKDSYNLVEKKKNTRAKNGSEMGRRCGQTFVQKEYTDSQQVDEKILNMLLPGKCK